MTMNHIVEVLPLREGHQPQLATAGSAAFDLLSAIEDKIFPGEVKRIPVGFKMALPPGHCALILPRSGMASKHFLRPANSPGLVDSDYRGEVIVALENFGEKPQIICEGDRIAQMLILSLSFIRIEEVKTLPSTERGEGGFGSTGGKTHD